MTKIQVMYTLMHLQSLIICIFFQKIMKLQSDFMIVLANNLFSLNSVLLVTGQQDNFTLAPSICCEIVFMGCEQAILCSTTA